MDSAFANLTDLKDFNRTSYSMEEEVTFCDTCRKFASLIDGYYRYRKAIFKKDNGLPFSQRELEVDNELISLGTLKDLQNSIGCTSCRDIARSLVQDGRGPPAHDVLRLIVARYAGLEIWADDMSKLYLDLLRLEMPNEAHKVGRLFNSQKVNVELLRKWIGCCHTSHRDHCLKIERPRLLPDIILIDVVEGCLISANMETRYVALSYVWGDFNTIQATKENLMQLQRPGSIDVSVCNLKLGKTVEDALRLVSLLGERHLWVDRLCIVQDDLDMKQKSLNAMGLIYANAYFTIVAAEGHHADHGLRGLGHGSQDRSVGCDVIRFPFKNDVIARRHRAWYPEDSPWESRAWTFQEALFSRRLMIFNGTVSWYCRVATWEEHVNNPTEDVALVSVAANEGKYVPFTALTPPWPDLNMWGELVEQFNRRNLTFDDDVMNASAGLTSIFDSRFSGGILWGIPEMFFDYCIIWRPRDVLRRRRGYNHARLADSLPSWSWVAWKGDIDLPAALMILHNDPQSDNEYIRIQSLTQWFKSREPTSSLLDLTQHHPHAYAGSCSQTSPAAKPFLYAHY